MKKEYGSFTRHNNKIIVNSNDELSSKELSAGVYTVHFNSMRNLLFFEDSSVLSDQILDLPSKEYDQIVSEMTTWLSPETKELYKQYGFLYKRSTLLHGLPGTGKTCIVQRVVREVVKNNGIVLYSNEPQVIKLAYKALEDILPKRLVLTVFEEFDYITSRYEKDLLPLLDGEVQKDNIMYLATTNYIDKIPARLKRPGRFSSVIEIKYPAYDARLFYFNYKLKNEVLSKFLAEKSEDMSVDELKEIIQGHVILKQDLEAVIERIKSCRSFPTNNSKIKDLLTPDFSDEDPYEENDEIEDNG